MSGTFINFTELVFTWVIFTSTTIITRSYFHGRNIERDTEGQESFQDHKKYKPLLCLLPLFVNCAITWRVALPPSTPATAGPDPPLGPGHDIHQNALQALMQHSYGHECDLLLKLHIKYAVFVYAMFNFSQPLLKFIKLYFKWDICHFVEMFLRMELGEP